VGILCSGHQQNFSRAATHFLALAQGAPMRRHLTAMALAYTVEQAPEAEGWEAKLAEAAKNAPDNEMVVAAWGIYQQMRGRDAEAEAVLARWKDAREVVAEVHLYLAKIHAARGDHREARRQLEMCFWNDPLTSYPIMQAAAETAADQAEHFAEKRHGGEQEQPPQPGLEQRGPDEEAYLRLAVSGMHQWTMVAETLYEPASEVAAMRDWIKRFDPNYDPRRFNEQRAVERDVPGQWQPAPNQPGNGQPEPRGPQGDPQPTGE